MSASGKQLDTQLKDFLCQVAEAGRDGKDPKNLPPIYENVLRNLLCEEIDNACDFLIYSDPREFGAYAYQRKQEIEGRP